MSNARGFTLLELIVTIAISAIVLAFAAMFVKAPVDAYMANSRQAELQDSISIAWPRMQGDIRKALPFSVRKTTNGNVELLELLPIVDSGRLLSTPPSGTFRTAGYFDHNTPGFYLAVDNDPNPPKNLDAYNPATKAMTSAGNQISPEGSPMVDGPLGEDQFTLPGGFAFNTAGLTTQRIWLVQKPVTYLCDMKAGTLQRFSGYKAVPLQSSINTAAKLLARSATAELVARNLTFCKFTPTNIGSIGASQTVSVQMTATRDGESTSIYETAAVRPLQ